MRHASCCIAISLDVAYIGVGKFLHSYSRLRFYNEITPASFKFSSFFLFLEQAFKFY